MAKNNDWPIILDEFGGVFPITSSDIKYLNNLNNELKFIFSSYIIKGNTAISGTDEFLNLKGYHFATVPYKPMVLNSDKYTIVFKSKLIYDAFKENKSKLCSITFNGVGSDDNNIYVNYTTGDSKPIACVVKDPNLYFHNKMKNYEKMIKIPNSWEMEFLKIDERKIMQLCDKYPVVLSPGDEMETVITKELIPGLKSNKTRTSKAFYAMKELDKDTFELYLMAEQELIKSYHRYKCFKW